MPLTDAGTRELAEEQAALRRVATLVARGVQAGELFMAVTEEVQRLLAADMSHMLRYEADGTFTIVARAGAPTHFPVGSRWPLGAKNALSTIVFETGRPGRVSNYADATGPLADEVRAGGVRSSVAAPIIVEGRVWGLVGVSSLREEPQPADTEARLASFTELVATAVANAESRAELARLAEEQAALRRVATLVARGVRQDELFAVVNEEVRRLLPAENAVLGRYEPDGGLVVVSAWYGGKSHAAGSRWPVSGKNLVTIVFETGRSARMDDFAEASGPLGTGARERGVRSSVAAPIMVEGGVWGVAVADCLGEQPLPEDAEARLAEFTELVATAIANAESRAELTASRARIVAAADETRRRIERDLHDGAQQRLVHTVIVQQLALRALRNGDANVGELMAEALQHAEQANFELSELAHGILPSVLTREGLRAGVRALVSRMSLPVSVDVPVERLPAGVEATAYFVVSEALTNVVKHAQADRAAVVARVDRGVLQIEVCDEGLGGAHLRDSTGLHGLEDRVSALDGHLVVESPPGQGTRVSAELPLAGRG